MSHPDSFINPLYKTLPTSRKHRVRYEKLVQGFDRQVATLLQKWYPTLANMDEKTFLSYINPLREKLPELATQKFKKGHIPFIIVVSNKLVSLWKKMSRIELEGKKGYTTMRADEIKNFKPIEGVKIPKALAYLAVDIETGKTSFGRTPDDAIKKIESEDRSPLTLEEGIALITYHPEILKDHCVWMPGSRRGDDAVAILWLNEGEPELYRNWAFTSHAAWGSASCGRRVGF